jgi:hypothetical protein
MRHERSSTLAGGRVEAEAHGTSYALFHLRCLGLRMVSCTPATSREGSVPCYPSASTAGPHLLSDQGICGVKLSPWRD